MSYGVDEFHCDETYISTQKCYGWDGDDPEYLELETGEIFFHIKHNWP